MVEALPHNQTLLLNSKRLTGPMVQQIAKSMGLPTSASLEDTRQMLEGKIGEMERELCNVQVVLQDVEEGVHITLRDADGFFLEIEPEKVDEEPMDPGNEMSQDEDGECEGGKTKALHQALAEANQHIEELNAEVRSLREGVERKQELGSCGGLAVSSYLSMTPLFQKRMLSLRD